MNSSIIVMAFAMSLNRRCEGGLKDKGGLALRSFENLRPQHRTVRQVSLDAKDIGQTVFEMHPPEQEKLLGAIEVRYHVHIRQLPDFRSTRIGAMKHEMLDASGANASCSRSLAMMVWLSLIDLPYPIFPHFNIHEAHTTPAMNPDKMPIPRNTASAVAEGTSIYGPSINALASCHASYFIPVFTGLRFLTNLRPISGSTLTRRARCLKLYFPQEMLEQRAKPVIRESLDGGRSRARTADLLLVRQNGVPKSLITEEIFMQINSI